MISWMRFLISAYLTVFVCLPPRGKHNIICSGQEFVPIDGANESIDASVAVGFDAVELADSGTIISDDAGVENKRKFAHIHNETPSLPSIYIINLDRATQRWAKAVRTMEAAGLTTDQFTRLSAVDGRALSVEELRNQSTKLAMFLQPRGVIGCYLSHRRFWQLVVDQRLPRAIVLEDDIVLVEGFTDKLRTNLQAADEEQAQAQKEADGGAYDVLFLGAIGRVHPQGRDDFGSILFSTYMGGNRALKKFGEHVYQPRRPAGTHAYMVTYEGAQKLLALCPKATFHVDLDAWRHASLRIRIMDPMLVYQTFDDSSLTDVSSKRSGFNRFLLESFPMKRLQLWARDTHTLQPWSHALAEPLLQAGPGGPVLTVERHCLVLGAGCVAATVLHQQGMSYWARVVLGGVLGFTLAVRSLIWMLMNWK